MSFDNVKLGSLLEVLTDYHANGAYKKLKENVELLDQPDYAIIIRTTNFEKQNFDADLKYVTEHAYNFLAKSKVQAGDIIMNKIANAGSSYLMPDLGKPVSLAMNLFLLRVNPLKANPTFVYIYLKVHEAYVKSFANGSVTKTITKDAVRNLEIQLPERSVQDWIERAYYSLTHKIQLNRQTNQTLEHIAQALFKSWFVDFEPTRAKIAAKQAGHDPERAAMATISGKTVAELDQLDAAQLAQLKTTAALFPDGLVESELGEVPEGWSVASLDTVAKLDTTSVKPNKEPEKLWEHYSIPSFDVDESPSYELGVEIKSNKYKVDPNSVLSSKLNPHFPRTWWPDVEDDNAAICSTEFMQFIPVVSSHRAFLQGLILSKPVQEGIMQRVTGSTGSRQRAQPKQVAVMKVILPRTELINLYSAKLEGMSVTKAKLIKENSTLATLRDTLLPKLLSGELSPTQAETA